ncbi:tRNA (5-methylaminomethyl-2-thiouridylate)-methyltransferase [Alloalcanivorax xenomutans]|jgi:tRNA-uridine 2-sulfurtransferase|uniref:tRNA (5-methylaminomethyl-2-thiouridylate)-methyltransferase n=1 Tax=Alloalcanivorax xenomutans TaxID=1094342 RepID=UPI0003B8E019|nr:tRNA (5-methylaminomethyl-2-thiouridylate)-methyltransferase [Alloalcanivorax xenomutans]ERS10141.1 tRNA (5-methylaminomethyl-2-thiouridylate)-methyltransferase [Alcanivorax sp. PN-3]KYZ86578.1 tRNA (5-methylaminomethyl-2-thiouridylate)-methyltransferase [Alcanivorax sp. KX64203]MBA4720057.1 tRNA (5-methylaminomethyl-2-thiouridylate)-methyltransferase [Alcanivorax sp.]PHS68974.1 MAG: tRNA (5-methylaminomethyl-2-thiouridylate)-methyltransferase [Alcanivorax sp.]WOA32062.1 tRNA (5-methylamino
MTESAPQTLQRRAIALVSGGLDSMLAVKVMQEQGIHVEGVNFFTGFCVEGHTHAIRKKDQDKNKRNNALWVAEQLGIKLHIVDISEEYKDVVLNPKHGYGANLNPCLDCKIFMVNKATLMLNKARELAGEKGFDFIITGEVVGQRPKSQRKETMPIISRESGADDRLLRPLSAKNLPETLPEREGWVDRSRLHDFSGRNRKPQMALAKRFGLDDFAQPAGGCCFLTDESYSRKLADLWQARNERRYELDDIMLLKVGRHIRPAPHYKLIISREEGENRFLEGYRYQFTSITTSSCPGPLALIDGKLASDDELRQAAAIVARYSKGRTDDEVVVEVRDPSGVARQLPVRPATPDQVAPEWMV